jgi:hypothetical protein
MFSRFATAAASGARRPCANTRQASAILNALPGYARSFHHFDTHHFVQRLEREGLNRAQAEGIMSAMAEVIDESVRNMTGNMVTKADQEKVSLYTVVYTRNVAPKTMVVRTAPIHSASRLCATQV